MHLLVIERTRNKFVETEIVATLLTDVQNKQSKYLLFPINLTVKLVDGRMPKIGNNLLVPNSQYCQFEQS